jgi:hypothetical protein
MGHAYIAAEGCDEALVLAVCSSSDEGLLESLYSLHGDPETSQPAANDKAASDRSAPAKKKAAPRRAKAR